MFKKKTNSTRPRCKKRRVEESSSSEDETKVIRKEKKLDLTNPMKQRTVRRQRENSSKLKENSDSDDGIIQSIKSKKTAGREGPTDMGATATLDIETSKDRDAQAIYERTLEKNKETRGKADDGIYRGMNNYSKFYEKKDTAQGNAASGSNRMGPIRAPDHIRSTVRWDYQPDLCKDFKETGYCGFGDSCKFLHDRTDYKLGWQLELEHQKTTKGFGADDSDENYEIPSDDEFLPFKCLICRNSFVDPVVTKCKHYYCEKCALAHYSKTKRCYMCNTSTGGIFQPAKNIMERLSKANEDLSDEC